MWRAACLVSSRRGGSRAAPGCLRMLSAKEFNDRSPGVRWFSKSKGKGGQKNARRDAVRRQNERGSDGSAAVEEKPEPFYVEAPSEPSTPSARNIQSGSEDDAAPSLSSNFGASNKITDMKSLTRLDLFDSGRSFNTNFSIDDSTSSTFKEQYHEWHPPISPKDSHFLKKRIADDGLMIAKPTPDGVMDMDVTPSLVNMEDFFDPKMHLPYAPSDWNGYEPATPLSDYLMRRIGVGGRPLTLAEFMRQALTHPEFGYYTNPPSSELQKSLQVSAAADVDDFDVDPWDGVDDDKTGNAASSSETLIGRSGDFVTAPEISHVFGHCLCVWLITQWQQTLGKPSEVQIVELGPGRGTLMVDILSLAMSTKTMDMFGKTIHIVHLVEASSELRSAQQEALIQGSKDQMGGRVKFEFANKSSGKDPDNEESEGQSSESQHVVRVQWHDDIEEVIDSCRKNDIPTMVIGQEFIDALPIHSFEMTQDGWRERLIDVVDREDNPPNADHKPLVPRLRQVVAPGPTPAVSLLLGKYENLGQNVPVGSIVEVCPDAMFLMDDVASMLEDLGGVALFVDYGEDGTSDTVRAYSNHKQVTLTSYPGQVDVTADVDFFVLKSTVAARHRERETPPPAEKAIHAFGPVPQGEFLMRMGVSDMVIAAIESDETTEEHAVDLTQALEFLVLPEHMGTRFKILALAPKRDGIFAPAGMES